MAIRRTQFRLTDFEVQSIKAACEFANTGEWEVFVPLARGVAYSGKFPRSERNIIWNPRRRDRQGNAPVDRRRELRGWLGQIVRYRWPLPDKLRDDVNAGLREIPTRGGRFQLVDDWGRRKVEATGLELQFDGPRAHYVHAVALLLMREPLASRLGRCKWCGKYFFNDREQPRGNRRAYCNDAHRQAFFRNPERGSLALEKG